MILRTLRAILNWFMAPYRSRIEFEARMGRIKDNALSESEQSLRQQGELQAHFERTSSVANDLFASTPPPLRRRHQ